MSAQTQTDKTQKVSLQVGDLAPNFTAKAQMPTEIIDIDLYKLLDSGQKVLLVFYPGDDTPGCTSQLCGIRDIYKEYAELGVTVLGVNPASNESHLKFIQKYSFQFGIIVDENKLIREMYGAIKHFFKNVITKRGVFLIDNDRKISFIHWGQQNNREILDLLKNK